MPQKIELFLNVLHNRRPLTQQYDPDINRCIMYVRDISAVGVKFGITVMAELINFQNMTDKDFSKTLHNF